MYKHIRTLPSVTSSRLVAATAKGLTELIKSTHAGRLGWRLSFTLIAISFSAAQASTLSQVPLLTQKGSVEPNLVFMFDDSASMPSGMVYQFGGTEGTQGRSGPSDKTYAAYSPDINKIYYDPRVRYLPRVQSDGVTYQVAGATNKYITNQTNSPPSTSTSGTYTIKVYFAKPYGVAGTGIDANGGYTTASVNTSAAYYTQSYLPTNAELALGATSSLTYPNTNTGTVSILPKFINRTDCIASATSCSWNEEQKNYGNWVQYHFNRLEMVKTGVGFAFRDIINTIRLGWGRINQIDVVSPSSGAASLDAGVALFNQSRKDAFYTWLYGRTGDVGSTPNRGALHGVGEYFKRADNWGPWANYPNPMSSTVGAGNVSGSFISYVRPDSTYPDGKKTITVTDTATDRSKHATCRRSFGMLVTDGYYNDSPAYETSAIRVGEVDSNGISSAILGCKATNLACATAPDLSYTFAAGTRPFAQSGSSNTLADIAMKYWVTDLRTDLPNKVKPIVFTGARDGNGVPTGNESFWQNMTFYAIGLGVVGTLNENATTFDNLKAGTGTPSAWPNITFSGSGDETTIDDMWHATINARGRLLSAKSSTELSDGIEGMLADINRDTASQAGVAASTPSLTSSTKKYAPAYTTGSWTGNIISTELDNKGADQCINWKVVDKATAAGDATATPYVPPTCSGVTTTFSGIPSHATRAVYSWTNPGYGAFNSSNSYVNSTVVGANDARLIDYLRGDQSNEDTSSVTRLYRQREFLLGDIVNSSPILVQGALNMQYTKLPAGTYGQAQYGAWLATKAARAGALFVGANDGMLHGFRESTGAEIFAFVPRAVMPNLHQLASRSYNHLYYVDGPLVEADACLSGGAACTTWSNLLLGTAGAGAKTVFAVDVTSPLTMTAANIKWEITTSSTGFANLGHILTDVQTGLTMGGQWVAVFGNGYNSADGKAHLYVVNLDTGAQIKDFTAGTGTGNGLGGVRLVYNNNDTDRRIVGVYAGDLLGNMWKFDMKDPSAANWAIGINGAPLYSTSPAKPITASPNVVPHPNNDGSRIVAFGTGKLFDAIPDDLGNTDVQSVYGVWDKVAFGATTTGTTVSGVSTLVAQTVSSASSGLNIVSSATGVTSTQTISYYSLSTNPIDWASKNGWYIDLSNSGQRLIYAIETLVGRYAAVDTISPANISTDPCTALSNGKAWNFVVDMVNGGGVTKPIFDTNGDGAVNGLDSLAMGYENTADGRTRYLKSDILSTSGASYGYGYGSGGGGGGGIDAGGVFVGSGSAGGGGGGGGGSMVFVGLTPQQQLPNAFINLQQSCIINCTPSSSKTVKRTWRQLFLR
jgi:type IV pilus assembly protein PilY1